MSQAPTPVTDALRAYVLAHSVREPDAARRLREEVAGMEYANWQAAADQVQFMTVLARCIGARRFLEIGTFAGYTTLRMALALPEDGQVVTCELNAEFPAIGERYWVEAGVREKIDLRLRPALASLDGLLAEVGEGHFDMAFIDADKPAYPDYYERCLKLVRTGGLVLVDNVLWDGRVIDHADNKDTTEGIRALNARIRDDTRIDPAMLTIADGLTIARKL